jgi:glycerophosphoryl diester phosphodiesterase
MIACPVVAMDIIAHRGASFDAPENTLRAVALAWEQEPDGVEIDVVLSRDGCIVLLHDENTLKTAGRDARVRDLTWNELRELDVGSWKDPRFAGERIPLLDDVLATVPPEKSIYIDIKCGMEIVTPLEAVIDASGLPAGRVYLLGEFLEVLGPVKRAFPEHRVFWNVDLRKLENEPPRRLADRLVQAAGDAGLSGLGLRDHPMLDRDFVRALDDAGQALFVWTVNDPVEARRLEDLGAFSLATDRPGWLRARMSAL